MDSLWTSTVSLPSFPPLKQDTKTDVLIVGGGLAGILTAYELKQAGIDALLIEAGTVCGGVSGNTTAKITSQHGLIYHKLLKEFGPDTTRLYWEANEAALDRYRALSQTIPCDFEAKDSYIYSTSRPEKLEQELAALEQLHLPASFSDRLPLPFPTVGAVRFKKQAQFHPLKFVAGLVSQLNIREHTAAQAFEGNRVLTNRGVIQADTIVMATHFPIINRHGSYFLKMYQHRSYVLALEGAPKLDGMYLGEAQDSLSFRNHGNLLLVGGGSHRTGKQGGSWTELEVFSQTHYPTARETHRWATQDCMTLDGVPYIGNYSSRTSKLYVATGFNKWGMTSSMAAALLLRDLLLGKSNPYAGVFSPSRTMLRPQLLSNAAEAAMNLLTIRTPRCPHMGCALQWNPQEHSWDCPCHGSRFAKDGALLNTPATKHLDRS